jgi:signal transduction histidine kinase
MTSVTMMMTASKYLIQENPDKLVEYCERTKELAGTTLRETREVLYQLRAVGRQSRPPLPVFFGRLCRDFEDATGVPTECNVRDVARGLDESVFVVLYRALQVGLINALRHGQGHRIRVFVWDDDGWTTLIVWNQHDGPIEGSVQQEGIGLRGLRERVDILSGEMRFGPVEDGYELVIIVPSKKEEVEHGPSPDR